MIPIYLIVILVIAASAASFFFSTLTYALRNYWRVRLERALERRGKSRWLDYVTQNANDLIFVTAVLRLLSNIIVLIAVLLFSYRTLQDHSPLLRYVVSVVATLFISLFSSVAFPNALARHAGEAFIASFVGPMRATRIAMLPLTKMMHGIDEIVRVAFGRAEENEPEQIEQNILSVVEEGEKEGVVDEQEREMIESVIQFRDTAAGQIMTPRPEVVGLDIRSTLAHVKETIEQSGHSRIPVYEDTLDKIVGILYARDLLKHLGQPPEQFDIRSAMRPPIYAPETKPLRDLLNDFRLQKIHIAIVLDEYGGTSGLVTIEDILEELVGDISDEHEPKEPAMLKRLDEQTAEADARIYVDELNRTLGLQIPEDAGYDTLAGFVTTATGRIPPAGTVFEQGHARYTILDAEPHKVNRVKIELLPQSAEPAQSPTTTTVG